MRSPASMRTVRDFRHAMAGTKARSDGVTVYVAPRSDATEARLGLAVGRPVGGAVVRNRLKRRIRAIFRDLEPAGADVVVKAAPAAARLGYQELENHLISALTRAGALS